MILMDAGVKARWIAALTSGDYAQTTGMLTRDDHARPHYCCLGVLCDLAFKDGVIADFPAGEEFPPDPVLEWSGLDILATERCVRWNDRDGLSFAEIAAKLA